MKALQHNLNLCTVVLVKHYMALHFPQSNKENLDVKHLGDYTYTRKYTGETYSLITLLVIKSALPNFRIFGGTIH